MGTRQNQKQQNIQIVMKKFFKAALVGCGNIANDFAREMNKMGGKVYSVANRTYEKAKSFAEKYGIEITDLNKKIKNKV